MRSASEAELIRKDGSRVVVQWGITTEIVTGRYLALGVGIIKSLSGGCSRHPVGQGPAPSGRALSARERAIVGLVALGKTRPEIAVERFLSHDTVRTHVGNAMEKVGARSRALLVANALGEG
jgi:DNA-binding CsgD family transcriptional regulator